MEKGEMKRVFPGLHDINQNSLKAPVLKKEKAINSPFAGINPQPAGS